MFTDVKSPISLVSTSATASQLAKAKEVEKKGPKKIEAMKKALKELEAGVKAAKLIVKKGDGTAVQIKTVQTSHKHVKSKTKAKPTDRISQRPMPSGKPNKPNKLSEMRIYPDTKFISVVGGTMQSGQKISQHTTLPKAKKEKPFQRGTGTIYEINARGKKGKPVMTFKKVVTKGGAQKAKWHFSNLDMAQKYGK